jgi:hypothetical protein
VVFFSPKVNVKSRLLTECRNVRGNLAVYVNNELEIKYMKYL